MRRILALMVVAAVAAVVATTAFGDPPSPDNAAGRSNDILGIVPTIAASHNAAGGGSGGNLAYHGGPVMHTNTVYTIYWDPAGADAAGYATTIDGFFNNVAAAKGATNNVYWSDTQYNDGSGYVTSNSTFGSGASYTDKAAFPSNGCSDSYTKVCLSDGQIQAEISRVAQHNGWAPSPSTEFFMFTAKGVGSCYSTSSCAFSSYCAYHSHFGSGSSVYLYANMPYAMTVPSACDSGQHPNANDADATINVTSHEHNETITDELGNAWYDRRGYENGDKCAWNFGSVLGGSSGAQYNQVIGTGHYYLQQEWSNHSSACVLQGQ